MSLQLIVNLSSFVLTCIGISIGFIWGNSQGRSRAFKECADMFDRD